MPQDDLPIIPFESVAIWESWLEANHADSPGLRVKIAKKSSGLATVTYAEAVEVAVCFGWIDGQRSSLDDDWFLQRFTPRRPRSRWSQINRERVELLIEKGLMRPAGLREIERAKEDGRWDAAYASPKNIDVPDDLRQALDTNSGAAKAFAALGAADRYAILYHLHHTTDPKARTRRIEEAISKLKGQ
jgi:uncharacterized protein YdeI (YjbR/CyaY-like superfamily)